MSVKGVVGKASVSYNRNPNPRRRHRRHRHRLLSAVAISKVYFVFTTREPTRRREWLPSEFCMRLSFREELHSAQIGTIQQISRGTDEYPPVIQTCPPCSACFGQSLYAHRPRGRPVDCSQNLIHEPTPGLLTLLPSMFHVSSSCCTQDTS